MTTDISASSWWSYIGVVSFLGQVGSEVLVEGSI